MRILYKLCLFISGRKNVLHVMVWVQRKENKKKCLHSLASGDEKLTLNGLEKEAIPNESVTKGCRSGSFQANVFFSMHDVFHSFHASCIV